MDIKAKIEEMVKKVTENEELRKKFEEKPVETIEGLLGVDLPDDQVKLIIESVKAKINQSGDASASGIAEAIKNTLGLGSLFGGKK